MEVRDQEIKKIGVPRSDSYCKMSSPFTSPRRDQPNNLNSSLAIDQHNHNFNHSTQTATAIEGSNLNSLPTPIQQITNIGTITTMSTTTTVGINGTSVRYQECLRNHAASIGGHVLDGCGEFMPGGENGPPESLKCGACGCHRNFHRKLTGGDSFEMATNGHLHHQYGFHLINQGIEQRPVLPRVHPTQPPLVHHQSTMFYSPSASPMGLIRPTMVAFGGGTSTGSSSEELNNLYEPHEDGTLSVQMPHSKKRFRTKFTQKQKDRMMEFAEKLRWKIQKQDEEELVQFCDEVGVKRQVFKVWMHNNKQAMKKKQT